MSGPVYDVVVVGGGIVGVSLARLSQIAGHRTLLLESGDLGGAVTGGSLACIGTHMISLEEIDTLAWACAAWRELDERLDHPMEYARCGQLRFVARQVDLAAADAWVAAERARGLRPERISPAEVREIEPALTAPIVAATWSPDDAVVNPFLAVRAIVADGMRHGLAVRSGAPVARVCRKADRATGVALQDGETIPAGTVVLAAGPWTARLAATAGLDLPIRPRRARCLATVSVPPTIRTVVGAVEGEGGVAAGYTQIQQAASGQILFNTVQGGSLSEDGEQDEIAEVDPSFVISSIETLLWLFPALRDVSLLRSWVRFEAVTPDDAFLSGPLPVEGLWCAAGDAGTGFVRAPALARHFVDALEGGAPPFPTEAWAPERFDRERAA